MTRNFRPSIKAGALFPKSAHGSFIEITGSQYAGMRARLAKKKLPPLPFTLDEYRADILGVMGGLEDGPIECRYCRRAFTLAEIAVDHAIPLSRGGSPDLSNLDYPCRADNDRKGSLTLQEYTDLLADLERYHPLARQDILARLQRANALAAAARRAQQLSANLKAIEGGKPPGPPPAADLGEF